LPAGGCWGSAGEEKKERQAQACHTWQLLISEVFSGEVGKTFSDGKSFLAMKHLSAKQLLLYSFQFPTDTACSYPGAWFTEELSRRWKSGFEPAGNGVFFFLHRRVTFVPSYSLQVVL